MAGEIYKRPIMFAVVAAIVILIGTGVTMFYPMTTDDMHPKTEKLLPYTALQLAGRDIYQREGCVNCHTQTVRPLKTEVMRYGEYSKAGEFAYDHPFLWGSKRTGPDLARIGKKYPDQWHYRHFADPVSFHPKSNMPAYGWLKDEALDGDDIKSHMDALGFPYTEADLSAFSEKNELDALVSYIQVIGISVRQPKKRIRASSKDNTFANNPEAIAKGKELYVEHCEDCHGEKGEGDIGPSFQDNEFLHAEGDQGDDVYFELVSSGLEEGAELVGRKAEDEMPGFSEDLTQDEIWSVIAYVRTLKEE
jgi:cytochrome c oxidase cbb3-type subunit 2